MSLKQSISDEAFRLGFSAFGVAPANYEPIGHNHLLRWLDRNYNADMKYMERATRKRFDPKIHFPVAKSVIICALNYYIRPDNDPAKPYTSIYARGENYHHVVKEKLNLLSRKIVELAGERAFKIFVDSSAFAEKTFAVKAGLGFIGRNGLLILAGDDQELDMRGSFHFLGVIITDLELEPDTPHLHDCGGCRLCIEACPTGAIVSDGAIDAARCISYQTTQNKGDIPKEMALAMKNIIFGCDICQAICPFNRKAIETAENRLRQNPDIMVFGLEDLLKMTEDEFRARFAKSSIGELGYDLFKRNVAIVSENMCKFSR
jgi:epoxyqueuosine reductase